MLILKTSHLHITLDHSFSFIQFYLFYISSCDLVFSCCCLCAFQEVNLCACEDMVKVS